MKLIKTHDGYILEDAKKNTIGQTFGKFKGKKLSIKNCQEIERGYDLDELVEQEVILNEWNVEIETQRKVVSTRVIGSNPKIKGSGDVIKSYEAVPKLDVDGCLILKRINTNSL
jgi:hypothetical protein